MSNRHGMTSYSRININTAHLIPTAAVWQGPKFITAFTNAVLKGSFLFLVVSTVGIVMSKTPVFNAQLNERQDHYELCLAKFRAQGTHSAKEFTDASSHCWAQANVRYYQTKTH